MSEPRKIPIASAGASAGAGAGASAGAAPRPRPGDTREIDEAGLDHLQLADGIYDSYSRTYAIDGLRWRIESKVCPAGGRIVYTLRAEQAE